MALDECIEYPSPTKPPKPPPPAPSGGPTAPSNISTASPPPPNPATRSFPSSRAPCSRTCAAPAPAKLLDLQAEGYAIGGLSVGEPRALSLEMAALSTALLPPGHPRYVMGVGFPRNCPNTLPKAST